MKKIKMLTGLIALICMMVVAISCVSTGDTAVKKDTATKEQPLPTAMPPAPATDGVNLVKNGDFSGGDKIDPWVTWKGEGGSGTAVVEAGVVHLTCTTKGAKDYGFQMTQSGIDLKKEVTYIFSFKAKVDKQRKIHLNIVNTSNWGSYSGDKFLDFTTDMRDYWIEFTNKQDDDPNARIDFNVAAAKGDVWVDDVVLAVKK